MKGFVAFWIVWPNTAINAPENWEVRDSQDSEGVILDEIPNSGERELIESISSIKIGRQMEELSCNHTVKNFDPVIVPV